MRKALFLAVIVALMACGVAIAADKIGTIGAPNASGKYPVEVFDDRSVVVASDATLTVSGTTSTAAITADSIEVDGPVVIDGTIYTATLDVDGGLYLGRATVDPCATLGPGHIFINNTTGAPCFCNNLGVDLSLYNGTSACF